VYSSTENENDVWTVSAIQESESCTQSCTMLPSASRSDTTDLQTFRITLNRDMGHAMEIYYLQQH